MADKQDGSKESGSISLDKEFYLNVPPLKMDFHIKGMDNADWGMKDRMSRIFNRKSGNHGRFHRSGEIRYSDPATC
jgi:hypothetical protein